ncbi:hypothetical protein PG994_014452 [Apiospora phragmitis]|uniref:Uncharacterized protein n=1 Tax=Apiospora phragmitis TaxID=2905665 RepID=A0ABR1T4B4_9PEZI
MGNGSSKPAGCVEVFIQPLPFATCQSPGADNKLRLAWGQRTPPIKCHPRTETKVTAEVTYTNAHGDKSQASSYQGLQTIPEDFGGLQYFEFDIQPESQVEYKFHYDTKKVVGDFVYSFPLRGEGPVKEPRGQAHFPHCKYVHV